MQAKKGRKKKVATDLDEAIILQEEEILEKEIKQSLKRKLNEEFDDEYMTDEENHIHTLFNTISSNEGHYAKIYRLDPVPESAHGHPLFLYDVRRPENVKDLERELQNLAIKYGWEDGLYEIRVLKAGVGKPIRTAEIALAVPHEVDKNPFQVSPTGMHTLLKEEKPLEGVAEMMKAMKELTPEVKEDKTNELLQNLLTNMVEVQKEKETAEKTSQTELLKALVEASKPVQRPQMDIAGILAALSPVLTALLAPKAQRSDLASLIEAKQAGVIPEPRRSEGPSALSILKELRESGLVTPPAPPQDPTRSLAQITELMGVMAPFMEKMSGGGGSTSVGVELVKTLVPQLGKIVGDVTGTINNAISAKATLAGKVRNKPTQPRIEQVQPVQPQTSPEILAIAKAVESKDTSFFPTLKINILDSFGDSGYESLVAGEVPITSILDQLKPFHPIFSKGAAEEYFNAFLLWAKEKKSSEFSIRCKKCSDEYVFDSEAEFKASTHNCEVCNTPLGEAPLPEASNEGEEVASLNLEDIGGGDEELPSD